MTPPIWHAPYTPEDVDRLFQGTHAQWNGMSCTEVGPDYLVMRMDIDQRTSQPAGIMHGGAAASLAESVGSVAANSVLDPAKQRAVGLELSISHLRAIPLGSAVTARATVIRLGRRTQVWRIVISDGQGKQASEARLTMFVADVTD